jgi:hypothetical protein
LTGNVSSITLFRVKGNRAMEETRPGDALARRIQGLIPPTWVARWRDGDLDGGWDGVVTIVSPSGDSGSFDVLLKPSAVVPDKVLEALRSRPRTGSAGVILAADYIAAPTRAKLERAGIGYVDATGWARIVSDEPMLVITAQGAAKSPKPPSSTAVTRLDGPSAGRVVRALATITPPVGVRELAGLAEVSPGTVSKTLPVLMAEGAVERDQRGRVTRVFRRRLLSRWTADYRVLRSNGTPAYFVAPRGLDAALAQIAALSSAAVTGARAGVAWLPEGTSSVIPVTQLVLDVGDLETTVGALGLVAVDAPSANVVLVAPQDPAILDGPTILGGLPVAPLPIVLADLLTLPGRYPQQAEALMDALAKTDPAWRP